MWENKFAAVFAMVASLATFLFGAFDPSLQILVVFISMDFITGVMYGFYSGTLSSKIGTRGTFKKAGIMMVIIIANLLDVLTGEHLFRMPVVYFFIATEGISILENLGRMGVPVPQLLLDKLQQLTGEEKKEEKTEEKTEEAEEKTPIEP